MFYLVIIVVVLVFQAHLYNKIPIFSIKDGSGGSVAETEVKVLCKLSKIAPRIETPTYISAENFTKFFKYHIALLLLILVFGKRFLQIQFIFSIKNFFVIGECLANTPC